MKVFITGADGALGRATQETLRREHIQYVATDIGQLDIANFKQVNETLLKHRPDVILHFAAISNVDACEQQKDLALRVNALGTLGLAIMARRINAKLLYVSTNFVFNGTHEKPYDEYAPLNPVNEYGRTKMLGEYYVRDICTAYYIVRTSWLFGPGAKTHISKFLTASDKPQTLNALCDQFASFTYTVDLAEALFTILKSDNYGIYHVVNSGVGSWLDFAVKSQDIMKFKTAINAVKTEELNLPAARPRYAPLASTAYPFLFGHTLRSWEDALTDFCKYLTSHINR
ncbi:dTDP-4-dehydrorhamnose reductase [candidate division WOR-3 bacterium]|nr:dTDP-4-dehydrorhamnose reductase [candidate division WOR-3 bacterium]